MFKDSVFIKNLAATAITGKDAWNRPTPQPLTISVDLKTDFHNASLTDNLKYSLNYAVISRSISEYMKQNEHRNFKSLANIGESISEVLGKTNSNNEINYDATISVKSEKSEIRADSVEFVLNRKRDGEPIVGISDQYKVNKLRLLTIIGVFTFERLQRQIVDVDLTIDLAKSGGSDIIYIHQVIEDIVQYVENSNFKTVETLVMKIGQLALQGRDDQIKNVSVKVTKPNAITYTDGVGVTSDMTPRSFQDAEPISATSKVPGQHNPSSFNLFTTDVDSHVDQSKEHIAYIAFGSNVGDQVGNINKAIDLLKSNGVSVVSTSSMYISKPMYVKDQADFYNGVLKVAFRNLSPHDLLELLKKIEYDEMARTKEFDNGPRSIDLDILLYDDIVLTTEDLNIPHISMLERTFVLQPLCELIVPDFLHPVSAEPIHNHLAQLLNSGANDELIQESDKLLQIIPIPNRNDVLKFDQLNFQSKTVIMGILNITPDSFSDAGLNYNIPEEEVCKRALKLVEDGATILDIGGVSTRPGSKEPTEEEEIDRVLPVLKAIRSHVNPDLSGVIISIDTYRSAVAEKCLLAGADIINDISMGTLDNKMFDVVAKYGCPYVMNHTRGTPKTMSKLTSYHSNTNEDIIEYCIDPKRGQIEDEAHLNTESKNLTNGVSRELALQMQKAFEAGVKKWQVILDPGLGFAKTLPQNLIIIKHASFFKRYSVLINERGETPDVVKHSYISFNGLSTLLGPSRKKFLGTICNEESASDRVISTGASIMACIEQNTDIVRVHDVKEMKKVCLTGDAIYRDIY